VRGRDFFAAQASQPSLDRWWGRQVPATSTPVYLLCHEDGLSEWLRGLDGMFLIAAAGRQAGEYSRWTVVDAGASDAAMALAEAVILAFSEPGAGSPPRLADVFDRRDAAMVANVRADRPAHRTARPRLPSLLDPGEEATYDRDWAASGAEPFDLLVAESVRADRAAPASSPSLPHTSAGRRALRGRATRTLLAAARGQRASAADASLAALLVERAPMLVVVGSRKGGVGKTSHAAGMSIVAGGALDSVGHRAAIVDANIANPDAWGQLNLPGRAATVRDVVAALTAGHDPPPPVYAATPALACYPERREGVEYGRTDIRRLAAFLRSRYSFIVVDMSNRLPDPLSGPEAAVAAFWLEEADALVLPTASSQQDFNGVLDYLDVGGLPPTVVPCIVSSSRRNRRHPVARSFLETIAARVERVVDIPDDADSVRLAGMAGAPVKDVSPRLGAAYRDLTDAVARLPARVRR
jgi:MinD-like ATPase involved in chromosome partitioning or flagellar assembly